MAEADAPSMHGRICLVTGATSGIGLVTARELARRGADVIGVGRDPGRCHDAAEAIRRDTGSTAVEFLVADLSSLAEIRRVASDVLARHDRQHVLVNNAGAFFPLRRETVDGLEMSLALNHLAYFLLTNLLLDALKRGAPARIINVSSAAHDMVKRFDFGDPQARERPYARQTEFRSRLYAVFAPRRLPGLLRYSETKLANLLFTYELARRLEGTGVTANALHPGFVATNFGSGAGGYGWFMRRLMSLMAITADEGARTTLYLATSPEVKGVTGRYYVKERPVPSSPASMDAAAARRLWDLSAQLTGLAP